jgi:hypothetical protein
MHGHVNEKYENFIDETKPNQKTSKLFPFRKKIPLFKTRY